MDFILHNSGGCGRIGLGSGDGQRDDEMTMPTTTTSGPMFLNDVLPFLGMCALAAGVYSLANWVGCCF
jgi:hypothetical protein